MFQPPNQGQEPSPEEERPESRYWAPEPQVQVLKRESEFLENVSKQTLILLFAAFFVGILLGKSMTPVVLKH
jgi:hypothetical protein